MEIPTRFIETLRTVSAFKAIDRTVQSMFGAAILNTIILLASIELFSERLIQSQGTIYYVVAGAYTVVCIGALFGIGLYGKKTGSLKIVLIDGFLICIIATANIVLYSWHMSVLSSTSGTVDSFITGAIAFFILAQYGWGVLRFRDYRHFWDNLEKTPKTPGSLQDTGATITEIRDLLFSPDLDPDEFIDIDLHVSNPTIDILGGKEKEYRWFQSGGSLVLISRDLDDVIIWGGPDNSRKRMVRLWWWIVDLFRDEDEEVEETELLFHLRRFLKKRRGATFNLEEMDLALLEYWLNELFKAPDDGTNRHGASLNDQRIVEFLEKTRTAWVTGRLNDLIDDLEQKGNAPLKAFAWKYGPRAGRALDAFYRDFPPLEGEFLVGTDEYNLTPDDAWLVLTVHLQIS